MSESIEQARAEVIQEMLEVHAIPNNGHAEATITEIFRQTLEGFLTTNPTFWGNLKFKEFILSVVGDIADTAMDVAYIRHKNPNDLFEHPLAEPKDIQDAARAVMVRRHDECAKFLKHAHQTGIICDTYVTSNPALAELEAVS